MATTIQRSEEQEQRHIPALDGIRGFALIAVFMFHALGTNLEPDSLFTRIAQRILLMGWAGVDLFFVLSGFLITTILLEAKTSVNFFKVFYVRRALRIFPLYYLVLIGSVLLMGGAPGTIVYLLFFFNLSNLATAFHPLAIPYLSHFWSLAIEEQFYFVWPAVIYFGRTWFVGILCVALILGSVIERNLQSLIILNQRWPELMYRLTPFRLDTLCAGALLAILVKTYPRINEYRMLTRVSFLVFGVIFVATVDGVNLAAPAFVRFGYSSLAISLLSLVLLALKKNSLTSRAFSIRLLIATGKYSYCFYLIHPFLVNEINRHMHRLALILTSHGFGFVSLNLVRVAFVPIEFGLVFGVCTLSWKYLERPILSLKSRFPYKKLISTAA